MFTEFASLQFTYAELQQLHTALLTQAMIDDALRVERGLLTPERRPMLEQIEGLLHLTEEELHVKDHIVDDALWEHAWYSFTEEWAWFRAQQESTTEEETEITYRKKFEAYLGEIDMQDEKQSKIPHPKTSRAGKPKEPKSKN